MPRSSTAAAAATISSTCSSRTPWMPCHTIVSWNALMLGYVEIGQESAALEIFWHIEREASPQSCVAALRACAGIAARQKGSQVCGKIVKVQALNTGMLLHSRASRSGWVEEDLFVATSLVNMYSKCGSLVDARMIFETMGSRRNVVAWNAMMTGYAENGDPDMTLELFARMEREEGCCCHPNALSYTAALKACSEFSFQEEKLPRCSKFSRIDTGIALHREAVKKGFASDTFLACTLISMYAKFGNMVESRRVFDAMALRTPVAWNALMMGYVENREEEVALRVFSCMDCAPNSLSFVAALKACVSLAEVEDKDEILKRGVAIHAQAAKAGLDLEPVVVTTLVNMYAKCGSLFDARRVFERIECSLVAWNALVLGYVENNEPEAALELFYRMQQPGFDMKPDAWTFVAALKACTALAIEEQGSKVDGRHVKAKALDRGSALHSQASACSCDSELFVASTLVDMYAKCGSMVDAQRAFDAISAPDLVSWTALILGYVENGQDIVALDLFFRLQAQQQRWKFKPDARIYMPVLKACANLSALSAGKFTHSDILNSGLLDNDLVLAHWVVDLYAKCGSMVEAQQVFDTVCTRDLMTWTALLSGYSRAGDFEQVFRLFYRLVDEGLDPDAVTLLCFLTACSHSGVVESGVTMLKEMKRKYGVEPGIEHYHCVVDLLGRASQLDAALATVEAMPFAPVATTWTTLLAACERSSSSSDEKLVVARRAFEALIAMEDVPRNSGIFTMMRNVCGAAT